MAKKSLIDMRKFVPEYFGNNREFQVFLRAVNIAFSVIKSNTDNFISNLLNPLRCKARLLPLLSNYVGWDYLPSERVITNRWVTKLYPLLVRNRGNEIGLTLAIALSICLMILLGALLTKIPTVLTLEFEKFDNAISTNA